MAGRKLKPYQTSWGEIIPGLCHDVDGRWRVADTGQKFTEHNEAHAIERYYAIVGHPNTPITMTMPVREKVVGKKRLDPTLVALKQFTEDSLNGVSTEVRLHADGEADIRQRADKHIIYAWFRDQLLKNPALLAAELGIPDLANYSMAKPKGAPIRLATILRVYDEKTDNNWRTKGQVKSAYKRLMNFTNATTLDDLTEEVIIGFRDHVKSELADSGAGQIFSKIKTGIAFASLQAGIDSEQCAAALARLKKMYRGKKNKTPPKPVPISRDEWDKLLAAANPEWRAIFLVSMNMSLYLEDVCGLHWDDFDFDAGTYVGLRAKTEITRVGWLWDETIAALKAIPRHKESPYVFTSKTGTRFNASSKYDTYAALRRRIGVKSVFSGIRDGAYTIACKVSFDQARAFSAHKLPEDMGHYVVCDPEFVRPCSERVYASYISPAVVGRVRKSA